VLSLLELGVSVHQVLGRALSGDARRETRQLGVVTAAGDAATFTGANCLTWAGGCTGCPRGGGASSSWRGVGWLRPGASNPAFSDGHGVSVGGAVAVIEPVGAQGVVRGDFLAGAVLGFDVLLGREWTVGIEIRPTFVPTNFGEEPMLLTVLARGQALFEL